MVTASGSGLDPDISPASAWVQVKRVAAVRNLSEEKVKSLVAAHIEKPLLGMLGPSKVNVLKLNVALDEMK
jgi:K+-transporting ATPase ATPase C chain